MGSVPVASGGAALKRAPDIRRVLSTGRRVPGRRLAAHVLAVPGETKVAFSSSRSVGGAVVRNRARRLMREAWRGLRGRTTGGHWIVLVAKPEIVGSGLRDVMGDLETVLGAAGVTK